MREYQRQELLSVLAEVDAYATDLRTTTDLVSVRRLAGRITTLVGDAMDLLKSDTRDRPRPKAS